MQDSHPSLYSTKTLYHLYIPDSLWYWTENVDGFIYISLEYTKKYTDKFFDCQGKMFLNIEKILVKINGEQP